MHQSTTAERVTAVISTLVAIALLGAAVTAQQPPPPNADRLESLESDLRFQLDMARRHDGATFKTRVAELDDTLAAWRASPRSPDDNQLLADWLEAAIDQTMPGSSGDLPTRPEFGAEPPLIVSSGPTPLPVSTTPLDEPAVAPEPADDGNDDPVAATPSAVPPAVVDETSEAAEPLIVAEATDEATVTETAFEPAEAPEHSITVPPETAPADATAPTDETAQDEPPLVEPPLIEAPIVVAEEPATVQVNLAELNARIGGYHQQLAKTEAAMVVEGEVTPQRLAALVGDVEELASQYQFIELYYESLSDAERMHVETPRPMGDVLALATGLAARDVDFLADFDAEGSEEPTLTERLKAVADAVGAPIEGRR